MPTEPGGGPFAGGILTIDLDAILANYGLLKARAGRAECAAAVKANAYGLGLVPVARTLYGGGCRSFFVADVEEGLALRTALEREARIYVLAGTVGGGAEECVAHRLLPVLNSLEDVATWLSATTKKGRTAPAALHLDTGMNRLGFPLKDLGRLRDRGTSLSSLDLRLIMSHLACAEEAANPMNALQLRRFRAGCTGLPRAALSLANSAGLFLGHDYLFDLVRPGAALYGLNPLENHLNPMTQVVHLQAKIIEVRDVDTGESVGYGATHRLTGPGRIATVQAGYADGFLRALGNRGTVYLGGKPVRIVGRVSMDLTTIDVTGCEPAASRTGTLVDLIGPNNPPDALAAEAGTNGYEMLVLLGRRYARRYIGGAPR